MHNKVCKQLGVTAPIFIVFLQHNAYAGTAHRVCLVINFPITDWLQPHKSLWEETIWLWICLQMDIKLLWNWCRNGLLAAVCPCRTREGFQWGCHTWDWLIMAEQGYLKPQLILSSAMCPGGPRNEHIHRVHLKSCKSGHKSLPPIRTELY